MIERFCKWYLKDTYQKEVKEEVQKQVNKEVSTLLDYEKEVFELGDIIYFYYLCKGDPFIAHGMYYQAKITEIKSTKTSEGTYNKYYLDVLDGRFCSTFNISNEDIMSKTKVGLRNKMLNQNIVYPIENVSYKRVNLDG